LILFDYGPGAGGIGCDTIVDKPKMNFVGTAGSAVMLNVAVTGVRPLESETVTV
jgi:hypothetical protein